MSVSRYAPGNLAAAVGPAGAVVLGEGADAALAAAAWEQLHAGAGVVGVIDVLAADRPLAALPDFVIAIEEGSGWRVAVRGALSVSALRGGETEPVEASGSPWAERSVPGAASLVLVAGAEPSLPLADGVARVSGLTLHRSDAPEALGRGARPAAGHPTAAPAAPVEPVQPHSVAEVHRDEPPAPAAPAPSVGDAPEVGESAADRPTSGSSPTSGAPAGGSAAAPPVPAAVTTPPAGHVEGITDSIPDHLRPPKRTDPAGRSIPGLAADAEPPAPQPKTPGAPAPISFVPGSSQTSIHEDAAPPTAARVSVPAPEPQPAATDELPDDIEATIIRDTGQPAAAVPGDHDGETVSLAEARRLREGRSSLPQPAAAPPRPPVRILGQLRVSTGQLVLLDRPVIIGRRPRSARVAGTDAPHLVSVPSPEQDISRNHVEVRAEGDSMIATDLNTTNGTTLLRRGAEPVRLHPAEPTMLIVGDVLDLGDDVRVSVEAAP
jgi:hypothetical protein